MIEKAVRLGITLSEHHIYRVEENGITRVAAKALKSGELRPVKGAKPELIRARDWQWSDGYHYDLDDDGDLVRFRMCPELRWGLERVLQPLADDRVVDRFTQRPGRMWMIALPPDRLIDTMVCADAKEQFLYEGAAVDLKQGDGVFVWAGEPHHCLVGFAEATADAKQVKRQTEIELRFLCHTLQRPLYLDEIVYDEKLAKLPRFTTKTLADDEPLDDESAARLLAYASDRNPVVRPIAAAWAPALRKRVGREIDASWVALDQKSPVRPPPAAAKCALVSGDEYRVLSIHPPWAWSIIFAGKDVENRSWPTPHRGQIVIHASSKKYVGAALDGARREIATKSGLPLDQIPHEFPRSQILGMVDVVDCIPSSRSLWAYRGEQHWLLAKPRQLATPVAGVDGKLNLWKWTAP